MVAIAGAVAAPLIGSVAEHRGQRSVLLALTPLNALALILLITAATLGWSGPALWAICLLTGATGVPVGSFTRTRWIHATRDPRQLGAAFSYESTVDELTFVLGPALVGIAASTATPVAPLVVAGVLVIGAGIPFALSAPRLLERRGEAVDAPVDAPMPRSRRSSPSIGRIMLTVAPAILVMASVGTFFGSTQTATTERAAELGSPGAAGLVYAVMGIGSAATALLVVLVPERVRLPTRILAGGVGMALFLGVTLLQSALGVTALALLLTGLFVGPTIVTAFSIAERRTAISGGSAVAMTSLQSAVTVGSSLGAALGGAVAEAAGADTSYLVGITAGGVVAVVGVIGLLRVHT
jgi:predicted MFS family arabinose efflux permease